MPTIARSVSDVVAGEAAYGTQAERFDDMLAIASTIHNRAVSLGVTPQEVVADKREFNAYGKALPPGVSKYTGLARDAIAHVEQHGPVHPGTFYATPAATRGLPPGLQQVHTTTGHQYFVDPQHRAIRTAQGYKTPDPSRLAAAIAAKAVPVPEARPTMQATAPAISPVEQVGFVAPVPEARPTDVTPVAPTQMAFKTPAVAAAFTQMTQPAQQMVETIERAVPAEMRGRMTVTSTAEPRAGLASLTHVGQKAAADFRTVGLDPAAKDALALAAMYAKPEAISFDHAKFAPHMHADVSGGYGKGLNPQSDLSALSEFTRTELARFDEARRTGEPYAPAVPEHMAPTPIARAAPVGPVERGPLADVTPTENFGMVTPMGMPDKGPAFSGPAPAPFSRPDPSPAQMAELSRQLDDQARSLTDPGPARGYQAPTAAQMADLSRGLTDQAAAMTAAPRGYQAPTAAQKSAIAQQLDDQARSIRDAMAAPQQASLQTRAPDTTAKSIAAEYGKMAESLGQVGMMDLSGMKAFDALQGTFKAPDPAAPRSIAVEPDETRSVFSDLARSQTAPMSIETDPSINPFTGKKTAQPQGRVGRTIDAMKEPENIGKALGTVAAAAFGLGPFAGVVGGKLGGMLGKQVGGQAKMSPREAITATGKGKFPAPPAPMSLLSQVFGFPAAPAAPANPGSGALTDFGEAAARGEHGSQAQTAANNPGKGLY